MLTGKNSHLKTFQVRHQGHAKEENRKVNNRGTREYSLIGPDAPEDVHNVRHGQAGGENVLKVSTDSLGASAAGSE